MSEFLDFFKTKQDETVELLTNLIEIESFSQNKADVDRLGEFVASWLEPLNPSAITVIPCEKVGDIVLAKWNEGSSGTPIMVLMHMDTVWRTGTLAQRPVTIDEDGRLFGPGASDMKGGLAVAMMAVKGLIERDEMPDRPIWLMFTGDEEIGSHESAPHIYEVAEQCGLVLVMEPPNTEGALKTSRKGVATYDIIVEGRASHAGNHPEQGINAILELSKQLVEISQLQDLRNGISVAPNLIEGGEAANIIAPFAKARIDVRTITQYDMDRVHDALMDLRPKMPGATVRAEMHHMRGPMERDELMGKNFEQCQKIAREIGIFVDEDSVGGGSDGNLIASKGIGVLDGLGPRGAGLHAVNEHIIVRSLPERAAHIGAIFRDWQFD